jgi:hypothetical protein
MSELNIVGAAVLLWGISNLLVISAIFCLAVGVPIVVAATVAAAMTVGSRVRSAFAHRKRASQSPISNAP